MNEAEVPQSLVGVFPADQIDRVERALSRLGVADSAVHIGEKADVDASLRAEQVAEVTDSMVMPQAGVLLTKETTKSVSLAIPVASVIGAAIALPFAFLDLGDISFWVRAFWAVAIGATMGGTIAYIVASAMALRDPHLPSAAQRGVVIRVDDASAEVSDLLTSLEPIRLDRMGGTSAPLETVTTEEDQAPGGIVEEVAENVRRENEAPPTQRHR